MTLRTAAAAEFSSSVFMVIPQVILTLVLLGLTCGMVLSVRRDRDRDFGG
ncbi:hypothetical protein [Planctomicrobium piriforme]|uniref:Uncharacterized protein n=1 Tax=Planctomicrobium piriforme TaxID=1576369 RepID=A0A1I3PBM1_9PLAN|nr:hypothetical protein [Planctomicrobium piriforme]SFJ18895.1 hypothetical protein SAMN05421753_11699 [Planctomicrobium piriforme]